MATATKAAAKKAAKAKKPTTIEDLEARVQALEDLLHNHGIRHAPAEDDEAETGDNDDDEQ